MRPESNVGLRWWERSTALLGSHGAADELVVDFELRGDGHAQRKGQDEHAGNEPHRRRALIPVEFAAKRLRAYSKEEDERATAIGRRTTTYASETSDDAADDL